MKGGRTGVRIGLQWKVGALMSALAAGLILAGIGAVWLRMQSLAGPALESAVLRAGDQVGDAVAARLDRLDLITRLLANDPPFRAYVAEGDVPSILDNLQDRLALYAIDAFVITDSRGTPIVDTRHPAAARRQGAPPADSPPWLLASALAGETARGVHVEQDGSLYLGAAVPLAAGEASAILALEAVDGELVSDLRQATGAELLFFSVGQASWLPGATTLPLSRSQLSQLMSMDTLGTSSSPRRLNVDGEEYVAHTTLLSGGGAGSAGFVALRSVERELASFRKIQTTLLVVGLVAIPLALVLGALFGRRIARPIATLVRATERVRAGDYEAPLPPETHDEVGVLAGAFRAMVAQLKQKEEMDAWLGSLAARLAADGTPAGDASPHLPDAVPQYVPAPETAALAMAPGRLLQNRFRILRRLGSGGMGTVWMARDERLGETVALKILPAEVMAADPGRIERFRQEITLARRITHRNVLRTHELLELDGAWAILMEHVDGVPLQRLLAAGRLPLAAGLRIARQICDGLEAAHSQEVIHRDLKPANVLVDSAGTVKIADFGLARTASVGDDMTRTGTILGTPLYMSPEQALGQQVDRRADIYSAGVVFYEMFCGRLPFAGPSAMAILRAHTDTPPPLPRSVNPALPAALEAVLLKALAKAPQERYSTARELSEALALAATEVYAE
ncbi:MAG TPA: protein kinase [Candidatus Polarisedimenticolia bacterium]|nr:protein kinase [Candidatus Polarisedimenticolia bacterium]